jgi:hypothetical protein
MCILSCRIIHEKSDIMSNLMDLGILLLFCCRSVYRDIGGSDPERMAAPKVAEYVEQLFKNSCIKVSIVAFAV